MPAGERLKLRMKIGVHELEADGSRDAVMAQLEIWARLAGLPASGAPSATAPALEAGAQQVDAALRAVFLVDPERKLVMLRAKLSGHRRNADSALLLLYGYQTCLGDPDGSDVPAVRLRAAVAGSGLRLQRLDRVLRRYLSAGLVRRGGRRKQPTYALTPSGAQHGAALVRYLLTRNIDR